MLVYREKTNAGNTGINGIKMYSTVCNPNDEMNQFRQARQTIQYIDISKSYFPNKIFGY